MGLHYFVTSGAVTAVGPKSNQLDTNTTATGSRTTSVMATLYKNVVLKQIIVLVIPTVAVDVLSIIDTSSSPITLLPVTVPLTGIPPYLLDIPIPAGGFLVTTTNATAKYMFVFEGQANV